MTDAVQMQKFIIQKLEQKSNDIVQQAKELRDDLRNALRELKYLCPHYDYKMELRCAIFFIHYLTKIMSHSLQSRFEIKKFQVQLH